MEAKRGSSTMARSAPLSRAGLRVFFTISSALLLLPDRQLIAEDTFDVSISFANNESKEKGGSYKKSTVEKQLDAGRKERKQERKYNKRGGVEGEG